MGQLGVSSVLEYIFSYIILFVGITLRVYVVVVLSCEKAYYMETS